MAPFTIGGRLFPSKAAAKSAIQHILHTSPLETPLVGDDFQLVAALLLDDRHPSAAEKIGAGIASIIVRQNPDSYNQRCFWLWRVDGTGTDFSYLVALNGAPNQRAQVLAALREEVGYQISNFRNLTTTRACELCARAISFYDTTHVDHAEPLFSELADEFITWAGGWDALLLKCEGPTGRRLRNRDQAGAWQQYHQSTARLRLVHASCNLRRGAR